MKNKKGGASLNVLLTKYREIPLLAVFLLLLLGVSLRVPGYIPNNYMNVLKGGAINLVMASGMLLVLLVGSIDISVASTLAFSGAVAGMLMRDGHISSMLGMFVVGIGLGALVGAVNGVLMSYGKVLPIIVTLGMSYVTRAMIPMDWLLGLNKIARIDLTESFKTAMLGNTFLTIPVLVWIAVVVALLIGLFLRYTRIGRSFYAVGSNLSAAAVRGVHTNFVKVLAHEMYAIATAVLGGFSTSGGKGSVVGVVLSLIVFGVIKIGLGTLYGFADSMVNLSVGVILVASTLLPNVIGDLNKALRVRRQRANVSQQ